MYDPNFEADSNPSNAFGPFIKDGSFIPVDFLGLNTIIYEPNSSQLLGAAGVHVLATDTDATPGS